MLQTSNTITPLTTEEIQIVSYINANYNTSQYSYGRLFTSVQKAIGNFYTWEQIANATAHALSNPN